MFPFEFPLLNIIFYLIITTVTSLLLLLILWKYYQYLLFKHRNTYKQILEDLFPPHIRGYHIVMISTVDPSGDKIGAELCKKYLEKHPKISFVGIGGNNMAEAGVNLLYDVSIHSAMGFWEPFKKWRVQITILKKVKEYIKSDILDSFIIIGSWGINNKLIKIIKKSNINIPIINLSPPEIWAWSWRFKFLEYIIRIRPIIKHVDLIITNYSFEVENYLRATQKRKVKQIIYEGPPHCDYVKPSLTRTKALNHFNLEKKDYIIGLMPGSRKHEFKSHLPVLLKTATMILKNYSNELNIKYLMPIPYNEFVPFIAEYISEYENKNDLNMNIRIDYNYNYDAMNICKFIIVASGTATLESALLGKPSIIYYKVDILNYWPFYIRLCKLSSDWIGIPNKISGKAIFKEIRDESIIKRARAENIYKEVEKFIMNPESLERIEGKIDSDFYPKISSACDGKVMDRISDKIYDCISNKRQI